jgi:nicotinamide riboside kinase
MNTTNKIGIIGTSSAGKTTLCYEALWRLKYAGVLCDGVLQQDRRFSFDRAQLETDQLAQYSFIANQVKAEADMCLRTNSEILICDRTPLDLYAYYETQYGPNSILFDFVEKWIRDTFKRIYVLNPLPYVNDGVRPSEDFRNKVNIVLMRIVTDMRLSKIFIEDKHIARIDIVPDILRIAGKILQEKDLNIIPYVLEEDVLIGGSYAFDRATKYSDVDVYLLDNPQNNIIGRTIRSREARDKICSILGVIPDIHYIPNMQVWEYLISQGFKELIYVKISAE